MGSHFFHIKSWVFFCYTWGWRRNQYLYVRLSFKVNEMGPHWVLLLLYLNNVISWPEDGRLRPKHVTKYNLTTIIATCLDVCCVLTVRNILYRLLAYIRFLCQRCGNGQHNKRPSVRRPAHSTPENSDWKERKIVQEMYYFG